ncbi:hypothetical protein LY90DRAFT_707329 [Neocallimastix californiae]|uniref:Uncharacterized protein n=1 Tax=Neocallimastix californiae TaxID=1754190 RepID=A0A1Y2AHR5_9FUNG|nr:hypothetical protein LY90DRAFT_707329 [Neocallimastix californiae]|eukprot:ORY21820.1 hypothetical protein LY90DRAFT_707329 [Neocallimastix californiae]
MNFKNILSVSVLAVLSIVNAAPVTTKTLPSVVSKSKPILGSSTKTIPSSYIANQDKSKSIIDGCKAKSGIPVTAYDSNEVTSVCLISYGSEDEIPKESTCFYHNEDTVFCIDDEYTSFKDCIKSSNNYSYFSCNSNVHTFVNKQKQNGLVLSRPLVSYPEKVRHAITPREDQKECQDNNGLVFSYQTIFQYLCLYPESNFKSPEKEHCVTVDGKPYCIFDDDTTTGFCKKSSDFYNKESCTLLLQYIGRNKQMKVEEN